MAEKLVHTEDKKETFLDYFDSDKSPREIQVNALNWMQENWNKQKVLAASLPCGTGKTAVAMAIANYNAHRGKTTAYITPQRVLQRQVVNEYPDINYLMGVANYPCLRHPNDDFYNMGVCKKVGMCEFCWEKEVCPYNVHKVRVFQEFITVFNPLSYYYHLRGVRRATDYEADTVIVDECQSFASLLTQDFHLKIWKHAYNYPQGVSASVPAVVKLLSKYVEHLKAVCTTKMHVKTRAKQVEEIKRIDRLSQKLMAEPNIFVVSERKLPFRGTELPCLSVNIIRPPSEMLGRIFGKANHVVLMSGTLFKTTPQDLCFDDYGFLDVPSPIPKERRLFKHIGCVDNSHKNPKAVEQIKEAVLKIASEHPGERGMVLASYGQGEALKKLLSGNERFIFHDKDTKAEVIEQLMSGAGEDKIFVLSGAWEGIDAREDLCRFIIITKCLFPNLSDPVVKRKMSLDKTWYDLETMKFVIQGANRATRGVDDFSVTYMLDSNFKPLYARCKKHLPVYFTETIKWS